ncbi:hypothetical protein [Stenotrophomonas mori]|uniref:Uncharacterized protein n=1 Tax=Stenotrophomonas mori TaxID=2871096 RepID=A0ABT0SE58_9GAMM|nr:hypothetical protein [Stenotrophomonas mori]MCL7713592.1 hypothetical protein [Stenotrophomonas mori]
MNRSDALTPEERALARLLGRPDTTVAPTARTDAAIAAQARTTGAPTPVPRPSPPPAAFSTRPDRRRPVWLTPVAVAASLVLAVGLSWQLRPTLPPAPAPAPDLPAPAPAAMPAAAPTSAEPPRDTVAAPATPPPAARRPAPVPAAAKPAAPAAVSPRAPAPPAAPPPPAPPASAERAAARAIAAPGTPAADAAAKYATRSAHAPLAAPAPPARADEHPAALAVDVDGASPAAEAVAAPPLQRRQWLQHIRAQRDAGDSASARASLRRFVQAHPHARIPRDLRPLLEE